MTKMIITTPEELQQLVTEAVQQALQSSSLINPTSSANERKYLTVSEAAEYLNLAKQTVYGFTSSREIPFIKRAKRLLFTKSDLDAWLAEGKKRSVRQMQVSIAETGKAA